MVDLIVKTLFLYKAPLGQHGKIQMYRLCTFMDRDFDQLLNVVSHRKLFTSMHLCVLRYAVSCLFRSTGDNQGCAEGRLVTVFVYVEGVLSYLFSQILTMVS